MAGVPAVIMTYLAEEIDAKHLPRVMGFYISGTSIGGSSAASSPAQCWSSPTGASRC